MNKFIKISIIFIALIINHYFPADPRYECAFVITATMALYTALVLMAAGTATTGYMAYEQNKAQQKYQKDMEEYYRKKAEVEKQDAEKYIQQRDLELRRQKRSEQAQRVTMLASSGAAIDIGTPTEWMTYQAMGDEISIQNELNSLKSQSQNRNYSNYMNIWNARRKASQYGVKANQALIGTGASILTQMGSTLANHSPKKG